jgi:hypothetical protein
MKAAVYGADQRLDFAGPHQFDEVSARQIPKDMSADLRTQPG